MAGANHLAVFYLVTQIYFSNGILSTSTTVARNSQPVTVQSSQFAYLPTATRALSNSPHQATYDNDAIDNDLRHVATLELRATESDPRMGYSYLKPLSLEFQLPSKDESKMPFNHRYSKAMTEAKISEGKREESNGDNWMRGPRIRVKEDRTQDPPRRSSYQVVEDLDEYAANDSDQDGLVDRGKAQTGRYPHRDSQDITTTIKALDHFLSGVLNRDSGYNSALHPPPNPVLALVLSRYGRYVPGPRKSRVYAHMAVNNIHNGQPFGGYKLDCEEEPTVVGR